MKLIVLFWAGLAFASMALADSESAKLFVSKKNEGTPATLRFPADLDSEERGHLYRSVKGYIENSKSTAVVFSYAESVERTILTAPFDDGTMLAVDISSQTGAALRLDQFSISPAPPVSVLRQAIEIHGVPPRDNKLPAPMMLVGGIHNWIITELTAPFRVWSLESKNNEPIGELVEEITDGERRILLERIAIDSLPFCVNATKPSTSYGFNRLWYRSRLSETDCKPDTMGTVMYRWGLHARGEWHAVETSMVPGELQADAILKLIPTINAPAEVFVQATVAPLKGTLLALMSPCSNTSAGVFIRDPADPAIIYDLRRLDTDGKEFLIPLGAQDACVVPGDLAAILARPDGPAARNGMLLDLIPYHVSTDNSTDLSMPGFATEIANQRVVGFRERTLNLHVTHNDTEPACGEASATEHINTVNWQGAVAAFVAAHPDKGDIATHRLNDLNDGTLGFLIVSPERTRGWLIAGQNAVVEINASISKLTSRAFISMPPSVINDCGGTLATRLLVKLHEMRGSPNTENGWPAKLLELASMRLLAVLPDDYLALLSDAEQGATVSIKTHGLGVAATDWSATGVARSALNAALSSFPDLHLSHIALFRSSDNGPVTMALSEGKDYIDGLGYFDLSVTVKTVNLAESVQFARAQQLADAIDSDSLRWLAPSLNGAGASLHFCDDGSNRIRLPAMNDSAGLLLQVDLALWRDGERLNCSELERTHDLLLSALRPTVTDSTSALVLAKELTEGLVANYPEPFGTSNRVFELFRKDGISTGCRSQLEGPGPAALAAAILANTNLVCAENIEFPKMGAALVSSDNKIGLIQPDCMLLLEPHLRSIAASQISEEVLRLYWNQLGTEGVCSETSGIWFALRDRHFARYSSEFREIESNATIHLKSGLGIDAAHDIWLAHWLRSQDFTDLAADSRVQASVTELGFVEVVSNNGAGRFLLSNDTCIAFAPPLEDQSMLFPEFALDIARSSDPPYHCDHLVVSILIPKLKSKIHAILELDKPEISGCLVALIKASEHPRNCFKSLVFVFQEELSGDTTLVSDVDAELDSLLALLLDARNKTADANAAALSFMQALTPPKWKILHASWRPHYDYLLASANDSQDYRFNVIDGSCNQISAKHVTDAAKSRGFKGADCEGIIISECSLLRLINKLPSGDNRPSEPLWYSEYFNGDPRNILLNKAAVEC